MDCDYLIVGSGFGGSVSGLRLVEKGYQVLMLEKGRRFGPGDFPETNWDLKHWLWRPEVGWRGLFKMTFLRHVTVLSGVGVGGGSLVYANTLPIPEDDFFESASWAHLGRWKDALAPHYATAKRMLGAVENPNTTYPDEIIREIGKDLGREDTFRPTNVAVYFGTPGTTVPDPFFDGEGPERAGCIQCGGCMLGCRYNAKNTLDKNYLYLAEKKGLQIHPDTEVTNVRPLDGGGYEITAREGASRFGRKTRTFTAGNVIFSGGVLGTVPLLLALKEDPEALPKLSDRLGDFVRTNSEALLGVVTRRRDRDLSQGIAIGSIVHTDDHSHLEPVRYPAGAGFFRLMGTPHSPGSTLPGRLWSAFKAAVRHPVKLLGAYLVPDWAKYTMILLYMRTLEGHLSIRLGRSLRSAFGRGLVTRVDAGTAPTASIPEATDLAHRVAEKIDGVPISLAPRRSSAPPRRPTSSGAAPWAPTPPRGSSMPATGFRLRRALRHRRLGDFSRTRG